MAISYTLLPRGVNRVSAGSSVSHESTYAVSYTHLDVYKRQVHISKMADHRIEKVEDAVKEGDMVWVKVMEIDDKGRVNLSMKDVKPEEKIL